VHLVLAGFLLVLLTGPFLHHDFACHQKSPTHCASCMASPFAAGVERSSALEASPLAPAGHLHHEHVRTAGALIAAQLPGRSPPSA
ncbi:MAG: hypothetical protein HY654_02320, partial [Acidobacteria bacterium]|nr:hypothetical protein [Acidobacteriota bacterium]